MRIFFFLLKSSQFIIDYECAFCLNFLLFRDASGTKAGLGLLSWIGVCEANSAFPQNFSLVCFHWYCYSTLTVLFTFSSGCLGFYFCHNRTNMGFIAPSKNEEEKARLAIDLLVNWFFRVTMEIFCQIWSMKLEIIIRNKQVNANVSLIFASFVLCSIAGLICLPYVGYV